MKKLLFLLPFFMSAQANAHEFEKPHIHRAKIENLVEKNYLNYKHPKAKKVGDYMPAPFGKQLPDVMDIYRTNKETGEQKEIGIIFSYDRNNDGVAEYDFVRRYCDVNAADIYMGIYKADVRNYAVHDVPRKKLYVDLDGDIKIDIVRDLSSLEGKIEGKTFSLPMIQGECELEEQLKKQKEAE